MPSLTGISMLKALYQEGRDFFDLIVPFTTTSFRKRRLETITAKDLQDILFEDHRIRMSVHNASVVITKLIEKDLCVNLAGKVLIDHDKLPAHPQLDEIQKQQEEQEQIINENFSAYCEQNQFEIKESFANLFMRFVESYHRPLLDYFAFDEPAAIALQDLTDGEDKLVAAYVNNRIASHPLIRSIVLQFLQGYSLMNAFRIDRPQENEQVDLSGTDIFLDSGILLGLLGHKGPYYEAATREVIDALKAMNAKLYAFHGTVSEAIRVLDVHRRNIDTVEGRSRLHPTDVCKHFLRRRYTSQDINDFIEDIGSDIDDHGIREVDYPNHRKKYTMDEKKLAEMLTKRHEKKPYVIDYRVNHDVDAVASVLTLRRGHYTGWLEGLKALFVSDGHHTTQTVTKWYREEGGQGIGPMMNDVALSNLLLLRRPNIFGEYKLNELGAVCYTVLKPSTTLWGRFVENVKKLEERGFIKKEEAALMKSTDMVFDLLIERSIRGYDEASDLTEVVENARNLVNQRVEEAIAPRNKEIEVLKQALQEATSTSRSVADANERLKGWIARVISRTILIVVGGGFVAWSAYDFIHGLTPNQPLWRPFITGLVALVGILGVLNGFSLLSWTKSIEERIKRTIGGR